MVVERRQLQFQMIPELCMKGFTFACYDKGKAILYMYFLKIHYVLWNFKPIKTKPSYRLTCIISNSVFFPYKSGSIYLFPSFKLIHIETKQYASDDTILVI